MRFFREERKTSPSLKEGVSFGGRPNKKKENKEKKGTVLGFDVIQDGIKYETVNKRECTRRARKWIFGSFQQKISGSNGTSEKVVLFFRTEYSNRKFAFHFFQAFSLIPVSALRGRFPVNRTDLICTNGKRDSGKKLTSPEFFRTICLNRGPIDRSARANGKQPMWMRSSRQGTAIICETKCISF